MEKETEKGARGAKRKKAPHPPGKAQPSQARAQKGKEAQKAFVHHPHPFVSEDDLQGMMRIRYLLGKIFETVQYLEYNLSLMLRYTMTLKVAQTISKSGAKAKPIQTIFKEVDQKLKDSKVDFQTFGNLISTLSERNVLEKADLDQLEEILQTRNLLAHQYFKKNRFEEQKENKAFLEGQSNYLQHFQNRVMNFLERICSLLASQGNQIGQFK